MMLSQMSNNSSSFSLFDICIRASLLIPLLFLGFHDITSLYVLIEIFTVVVAYVIFILLWSSRSYVSNGYVLFIGISYFFVGSLDLLHILTHELPILPLFRGENIQVKSQQLWLVSRLFQGISFLLGLIFLYKRVRTELIFFTFLLLSTVLVLMLRGGWLSFPVTNVNVIHIKDSLPASITEVIFLSLTLYFLFRLRGKFKSGRLHKYLVLLISSITISEILYIITSSYEDIYFLLASVFRLFSYYFLYEAVVKTALEDPYTFFTRRSLYDKERLYHMKDMYGNLFETINLAVVVVKPINDGNSFELVNINKWALELDHLDKSEVIGLTLDTIWPGVGSYGILEVYKRVNRTGIAEKYPSAFYVADKQKIWRTSHIYKLASGHLVSVYSDETAIKKTEEQLKESEKRYRTVANFTYDWEYWLDPNGTCIYTSPSCERITGYPPEKFMQDYSFFDSLIYEDDYQIAQEHGITEDAKDAVHQLDFRIVAKDGSIKWISHACLSVYDEDGTFLGRRASNRDITARKISTMEVANTKALLESLFSAIGVPIFYKDLNHRYIGFNQAFIDFFGGVMERLIGATVYDIYPPDIANEWYRSDMKIFKDKKTQIHDTRILDFKGVEHDVYLNKSVYYDAEGNLAGSIGVIFDVTDRKKLESDLIKERDLHLEVKRIAKIGHWELLPDEELPTWSKQMYYMLGVDPTGPAFNKDEYINAIGSDHWASLLEYANDAKYNGIPFDMQFKFVTNDGESLWFHIICVIGRGLKSKRIYGTIQDITEYKNIELALKESELLYTSLLDSLNVSICRVSAKNNDTFLKANPATLRMFDADNKKDLTGTTPDSLWYRVEDKEEVISELNMVGSIKNREIDLRRLDGTKLIGSVSAVTVRDTKNRPLYYDTILEDITVKKDLEVQLQHAIKMEAMGRLAGGIAHDFNNTLGVLIGYSDLLLKDIPKDSPYRKAINAMHTGALRAKDLIAQLLTFGRKNPLKISLVNVNILLTEFNSFIDHTLRDDIQLELNILVDRLYVEADISQLEHVLINLAVNAQDAMPNGGKLIVESKLVDIDSTCTKLNVVPGKYLLILMSDTGHGMAKDIQEKVFEPFFTTKPRGYGTGLGLSTAYSIVRRHGGDLRLYSEVNTGTTFKIYLPVFDKKIIRKPSKVDLPESISGSETIILVEDDVAVLSLVHGILNTLGYRVYAYASPTECVEQMKDANIDIHLLLTDVIMAGMNGKDLCDVLLSKFPAMKYIYMSGYTNSIIIEKGVLKRNDLFIQKPFTSKELGVFIRKILDNPIS